MRNLSFRSPKSEVRESRIHGKGLFARQPIARGEIEERFAADWPGLCGHIDAWHARGVACHAGYIIGFPYDSATSVRAAVRELRDGIGVDQASFFMLTPLPGSRRSH